MVESPGAHPNPIGLYHPARSCLVQGQVCKVRGGKPVTVDLAEWGTGERTVREGRASFADVPSQMPPRDIHTTIPQMAQKTETVGLMLRAG